MLNISDNNKHSTANLDRFKTKGLASRPYYKILNRLIIIAVIVAVICSCLGLKTYFRKRSRNHTKTYPTTTIHSEHNFWTY
jgi:hypothetical protein